MYSCSCTALAFAAAIILLPLDAHAGFKPGASFHPPAVHRHAMHGFHKFSHHHHHRNFFALGVPFTTGDLPFYGSDYDPADAPAVVDPALFPEPAFTGSIRPRAFYRTGCRSEEVSVPSAHGQTSVTVTRCSVPILDSPPLK